MTPLTLESPHDWDIVRASVAADLRSYVMMKNSVLFRPDLEGVRMDTLEKAWHKMGLEFKEMQYYNVDEMMLIQMAVINHGRNYTYKEDYERIISYLEKLY